MDMHTNIVGNFDGLGESGRIMALYDLGTQISVFPISGSTPIPPDMRAEIERQVTSIRQPDDGSAPD